MKYSFPKLVEILAEGRELALATIVRTNGSAPQVPGASAVFSRAGLVAGTVGGGILEAKAGEISARCLDDRRARLVTFRLDADPADGEGAICGGAVEVLFDPHIEEERSVFKAASGGFRRREPGVILTGFRPPAGDIVDMIRRWVPQSDFAGIAPPFPADDIEAAFRAGSPMRFETGGQVIFVEPVLPLPRLVIAGAGHVGRAVAHLGKLLDFEVTVVDDRPEFASPANVPDADRIIVGVIAEAVRGVEDSASNHFVIVTRGHRHDAEALRACLGRPSAYVGMIGSRTKIDLMRREFLERGWATAEEWAGIRAPIGLDIGSKTVEEIAVSIAAELVRVRSLRNGGGGP